MEIDSRPTKSRHSQIKQIKNTSRGYRSTQPYCVDGVLECSERPLAPIESHTGGDAARRAIKSAAERQDPRTTDACALIKQP